jgi:predicted small lipoprotein YifL
MSKVFSLLMILVLLAGVLAGCGTTPEPTVAPPAPTTAVSAPTTAPASGETQN